MAPEDVRTHDSTPLDHRLRERPPEFQRPMLSLGDIGFAPTKLSSLEIPTGSSGDQALFEDFFERMDDYHATRDFPAANGPSYLGVHLRFGTVSIRQRVRIALQRQAAGSLGAAVWLGELVWRDFFFAI